MLWLRGWNEFSRALMFTLISTFAILNFKSKSSGARPMCANSVRSMSFYPNGHTTRHTVAVEFEVVP